jgi:hypothetical protein
MKRGTRIWICLEAPAEEENRRGAILDRLLRAFEEGGKDAAVADLDAQIKELEANFDKALEKLDNLLRRSPTP